jgi:hypothetical protein
MAEAEGDGGGRTMPVCDSPLRLAPRGPASFALRGDDAEPPVPAALLSSDPSGGISTRSLGRNGPPGRKLFCRDGGVNMVSGMDEMDTRDLG